MLDLFLALVDRLLDLAKSRSANREKWVATITSLHKELTAVHSDYLVFLENARRGVEAGTPVRDVLRTLAERRLQYEAARGTLRATVAELREHTLGQQNHFTDYLLSVDAYMRAAGSSKLPLGSATAGIIQDVEMQVQMNRPESEIRESLEEQLDRTLDWLRSRFANAAEEYGEVQASAL